MATSNNSVPANMATNVAPNVVSYVGINKSPRLSGASLVTGEYSEVRLKERFSRMLGVGGWPIDEVSSIDNQLKNEPFQLCDHSFGAGVLTAEFSEQESHHLYENLLVKSLTRFSPYFNNKIVFVPHHRCHANAAASVSPFEKSVIVVLDTGGSFYESFPPDNIEVQKHGPKEMPKDSKMKLIESCTVYFQNKSKINCIDKKWRVVGSDSDGQSLDASGDQVLDLLESIRQNFPRYQNLILTGSSALNRKNNMRIVDSKLFSNFYVPPFPGDESISLGAAMQQKLRHEFSHWKPKPIENQNGCFGPFSSIPENDQIRTAFKNYDVKKSTNIFVEAARLLQQGRPIGWFQNRSESGCSSLGNRSILVNPLVAWEGQKERAFGLSCLWNLSHEYFHVPEKFESPFMSFAARIRTQYCESLKSGALSDGSANIQTVRESQNFKFHRLITEFGVRSGLFCLLNINMSLVGEPLVEDHLDALRFFEGTEINYLVIGDFLISKKANR